MKTPLLDLLFGAAPNAETCRNNFSMGMAQIYRVHELTQLGPNTSYCHFMPLWWRHDKFRKKVLCFSTISQKLLIQQGWHRRRRASLGRFQRFTWKKFPPRNPGTRPTKTLLVLNYPGLELVGRAMWASATWDFEAPLWRQFFALASAWRMVAYPLLNWHSHGKSPYV